MSNISTIESIRKQLRKSKNPVTARQIADKLHLDAKRVYDRLWGLEKRGEAQAWDLEIEGGKVVRAYTAIKTPN